MAYDSGTPAGSPEDDRLMARYAAGDRAAARMLTERFAPRAYAHALRLLGDAAEAEDVAQEAMLRLWRQAPVWQGGRARVSTWLYRVVGNLVIDRQRRKRPEPVADLPETGDPEAQGGESALMARDRAAQLQAALLQLPERQRQAVVLRHIDGCNVPEVAQVLDVSVRAAESLIARGKRGLEAILLAASNDEREPR